MAGKIIFYQRIIESMNEGIMALDPKGRITMFNDPAGEILGLSVDQVLDRPFGQVFMMEMEDNDSFSQMIMDAVYDSAVGRTETISFKRPDGQERVLSLSTSYLRPEEAGKTDTGGVVVVFNDITEMTRSREKEEELNLKLRNAFIDVENSNQKLEAALKKVQWVRVFITLLVVLGFSGMGYALWQKDLVSMDMFRSPASATVTPSAVNAPRIRVDRYPIQSSISLSGVLAPLEEINVIAPFEGKIRERLFAYDQQVKKGDRLFVMDTDRLEVEFRDARAALIKAELKYKELVDWEKSSEVASARRSFTKANTSLDMSRRKLEENKLLFEKGIISKSEFESTTVEYENQKLDCTASKENLDAVLSKGSSENLDIAKMELANARDKLFELRNKLSQKIILAPVSGIVMIPSTGGGKGESKGRMEAGTSVNQGDVLVGVGNLDGLSVKAQVDEIDIGKIEFGMKVRVSGDAFPDLAMKGRVRQISANATSSGGISTSPLFDVGVAIDTLTPAQRQKIRLGMSANLSILVYDNPEALVLPLGAVEIRNNERWVKKLEEGQIRDVRVTTGMTTLDGVEILSGLSYGDTVLLDGPSSGGFSDEMSMPGVERR